MSELFTMPKLGFDMAVGTLSRWVKQIGEEVNKGDILVEVETDKATVEVEAFSSGILRGIFVDEGAIVPVGATIAVLGTSDEEIDLEALKAQAAESFPDDDQEDEDQPKAETAPAETVAEPIAPAPASDGMLRVSPVAQRIALENGVDLRQVKGSGPQGRIVRRDVEAFLASPPPPSVSMDAGAGAIGVWPTLAEPVEREDTTIKLSRLRQAIGKRMAASKSTLPHFYVTNDIDMAAVMDYRAQLNNALEDRGVKVSVNDFIIKAVALALRDFSNLNAVLEGSQLVRKGNINIGVAVAVEGGLLTVVCKNADTKSLAQISVEVRAMATRARSGKVHPDDIDGSTFTTSNLGMFDVEHFSGIINPPEAALLATGSVQVVPVVKDGELAIGTRMKATISADHRVTDGAEAARYMQALKRNLEEPLRLML